MAHYADSVRKPPKTLTHNEQLALLRVTGDHRDGFRDHVIYSLALGTALREHEIVALNVGDVSKDGKGIRLRFPLRVFKESNRDASMQEAILPDAVRYKLEKYLRWKKQNSELLTPDSPLFISQRGERLGVRGMRHAFAKWQERAGFERHLHFHGLRHTALSNLYQTTKDIRLVQRVARHASVSSTTIYAQASDDDVLRAVRALPC